MTRQRTRRLDLDLRWPLRRGGSLPGSPPGSPPGSAAGSLPGRLPGSLAGRLAVGVVVVALAAAAGLLAPSASARATVQQATVQQPAPPRTGRALTTTASAAEPSPGGPIVAPLADAGGTPPDAVELPPVRAEAFLLADLTTGQVLVSRNATQPRPMASTTKIMTALLALDSLELEQPVTIGQAPAQVGESGMALTPGERLTVRQLLAGLLVHSANDAAVALAEAADGSVGAFVHRMNDRARKLGLTATRFANPHGLDQPGHHTSARDLARLWLVAMENPTFRELAATKTARLPGPPETRELTNTNELLGSYAWLEGGKTGFTDAAGRCLVASAERGGRHLVAVALGSPNAFADVHALLEHGFGSFVRARLAAAGEVVAVDGYGSLEVTADVDALVRRDLLDELALSVDGEAGAGRLPGRLTAGAAGAAGGGGAGGDAGAGQVIGTVTLASRALAGSQPPAEGAGTDNGRDPALAAAAPVEVEPVPVPPTAAATVIDAFLSVP